MWRQRQSNISCSVWLHSAGMKQIPKGPTTQKTYPKHKTDWWLNIKGMQNRSDSCGTRVINGPSPVHSFRHSFQFFIHFMNSVKKNTDNEIPANHLPFPFPWHSIHWRYGHSWHAACVSHTVAPPSWPVHATGCRGYSAENNNTSHDIRKYLRMKCSTLSDLYGLETFYERQQLVNSLK
jgi:hypothetical protein